MAKEIERKFLLKKRPIISTNGWDCTKVENIQQGYLILGGTEQVRIRVVDYKIFKLGYKNCLSAVEREEVESSLSTEMGQRLYNLCKDTLEKVRTYYFFKPKGIWVEVDKYPNGLEVVEIEVSSEKNFGEIIDFLQNQGIIGEEITGDKKYSNIQIAKQNS